MKLSVHFVLVTFPLSHCTYIIGEANMPGTNSPIYMHIHDENKGSSPNFQVNHHHNDHLMNIQRETNQSKIGTYLN